MKAAAQRVLVVDDDETLLRASARSLRHDHHVTTARTASETLAVVQRQPIDVAIIDFRLGDHEPDGIALIAQVKAAAPAIACVLYSAFAHTRLAVEAIQAGATDVVSKTEQARTILARLAGRPSRAPTRPTLAELEREYILRTLAQFGGNKRRAARELGSRARRFIASLPAGSSRRGDKPTSRERARTSGVQNRLARTLAGPCAATDASIRVATLSTRSRPRSRSRGSHRSPTLPAWATSRWTRAPS